MTLRKLLVIAPGFPHEGDSYTIPYLSHLLPELSQRHDFKITVIAVHKPFTREPYTWRGIEVVPLNGRNASYPIKAALVARCFATVRSELKKGGYAGILNLWYNEFAVMSKYFHRNHYTYLLGRDVLPSNRYMRWFRPDPSRLIAVSGFANDTLEQSFGLRATHTVPIAVSPALFPKFNDAERPIDLFGAGWLTDLKNYILFAEAVLEIRKSFPEIRAEIAGDGPRKKQLEEFISLHGLERNLRLCGLLTHEQTLEKMNQSKIFLHTSRFEAGATVYAEALYSGCQVVGTVPVLEDSEHFTSASGIRDIVEKIKSILEIGPKSERVVTHDISRTCAQIEALFAVR